MAAYYNEIEPFAAQWLRNLIAAGHIAPGEVDERDIRDVTADDLRGFAQCHFFAGIGVWSYALRKAGWPDDREVWTGSCPCQPFSSAGKRQGHADERHLWPAFFRLIQERRPPAIFGEQVASKDGLAWFDTVAVDLESAAYAVGAVDFCAAGVGAPHIRQRLWFLGVADEQGQRCQCGPGLCHCGAARAGRLVTADGSRLGGLVDGELEGSQGQPRDGDGAPGWQPGQGRPVAAAGAPDGMGDGPGGVCGVGGDAPRQGDSGHADGPGRAPGQLADAEHDGSHRPEGHEALPGGNEPGQRLPLGNRAEGGLEPGSGGLCDTTGARCEGGPEQGAEGEARDEARLRGSRCGREHGGVADPDQHQERQGGGSAGEGRQGDEPGPDAGRCGGADGLVDADLAAERGESGEIPGAEGQEARRGGHGYRGGKPVERMGNADEQSQRRRCGEEAGAPEGLEGTQPDVGQRLRPEHGGAGQALGVGHADRPGPTNGFWRDTDWLFCRDGRWRPVRPGTFPLVNGAPARVGRLRAYGNAINAEAATEFIMAGIEAIEVLQ